MAFFAKTIASFCRCGSCAILVLPKEAWGKFSRGPDGDPQFHPLKHHCADVAACFEALLAQPTIVARLATLAGQATLSPVVVSRLAALVFLHDIGKANWGFQEKILPNAPKAGHVRELCWLMKDPGIPDLRRRLGESLPLADMSRWFAAKGQEADGQRLLLASVSHHGTPWAPTNEKAGRLDWWRLKGDYDPMASLAELGCCLRTWFKPAFESEHPPFDAPPAFQHAFAGLVMLADWLGSDRRVFPYSKPGDPDRMKFARKEAPKALARIGLAVEARRSAGAARGWPGFGEVFADGPRAFAPNAVQRAAMEVPLAPLMILESETGSGKTEAAFWYFKRLFEAGKVDGLYFALPTRVAATQLHTRICGTIARLFPDEADRPGVVLAVPGYLKVDDVEGQALPGFEVLWPDSAEEQKAHQRWAAESPKRFLAAQIAVGTIDQVLLSALMLRHAHLRSSALLRHLLVVDEVHASDIYMTRLLHQVLGTQLSAGGHALLLSATLGANARSRFMDGIRSDPPEKEVAIALPYPLLSWRGKDGTETRPVTSDRPEKRVRVVCRPEMAVPEAIAKTALAAARRGAKVLVVRNTVGTAVAVQRALEEMAGESDRDLLFQCNGRLTLHHGRFARGDRRLLDRAVEEALGKDSKPGGRVVCGTQTLEQSLDLDADLLITDLCPMDVLLQRIGRLHRHQRSRPDGFEDAHCQVLIPADRPLVEKDQVNARHGLGSVYPDRRVLETTQRELAARPTLTIPAENRELVEKTTHPSYLDALGADWESHRQEIVGKGFAQSNSALLSTFDRAEPFGKTFFPAKDQRIGSRLGSRNRLVVWAEGAAPDSGPFGQAIGPLVIPEHLCRGLAEEAEAEIAEQDGSRIVFRLRDLRFSYHRFGLERVAG